MKKIILLILVIITSCSTQKMYRVECEYTESKCKAYTNWNKDIEITVDWMDYFIKDLNYKECTIQSKSKYIFKRRGCFRF